MCLAIYLPVYSSQYSEQIQFQYNTQAPHVSADLVLRLLGDHANCTLHLLFADVLVHMWLTRLVQQGGRAVANVQVMK